MLFLDKLLGALSPRPPSNFAEFSLLIASLFVTLTAQAQSLNEQSLNLQPPNELFLSEPTLENSFATKSLTVPISASEEVHATLDFAGEAVGAYDERLVDPLFYQARTFLEAGRHDDASSLFKEALHLLRINNGLYDASQIDVLDYLIESEIAQQDWEEVDKHYAYMEHLYRRLYNIDDPRLELGLQKVVSWHVNALNVNLDGKRMEHLQQASKLFKLRLQVAQLTLTADDPKLDFLYRNIAICERQLYLGSDLNKEMLQRQEKVRQRALLADLD